MEAQNGSIKYEEDWIDCLVLKLSCLSYLLILGKKTTGNEYSCGSISCEENKMECSVSTMLGLGMLAINIVASRFYLESCCVRENILDNVILKMEE